MGNEQFQSDLSVFMHENVLKALRTQQTIRKFFGQHVSFDENEKCIPLIAAPPPILERHEQPAQINNRLNSHFNESLDSEAFFIDDNQGQNSPLQRRELQPESSF